MRQVRWACYCITAAIVTGWLVGWGFIWLLDWIGGKR